MQVEKEPLNSNHCKHSLVDIAPSIDSVGELNSAS